MVLTDVQDYCISAIHFDIVPNAIGIGPGLGQDAATQQALYEFLKTNTIPLVLDADALNILALHPDWLSLVAPKTIVTPHLKELERLMENGIRKPNCLKKQLPFLKNTN